MKLEIIQEDCPTNPREFSEFGKFVTWNSRHYSPDENDYAEPWLMKLDLCLEVGVDLEDAYNSSGDLQDRYDYLEDYVEDVADDIIEKGFVILPVYIYDHGGVVYSTSPFSCPWDSGQVGFIYVSHKDIIKVFGNLDIDRASEWLSSEVETYSQWASGDVWGYVITDDLGEELDSCWGFYGRDYCEREGQQALLEVIEARANSPELRADKIYQLLGKLYSGDDKIARCVEDMLHWCRLNKVDFDAEVNRGLENFQDSVRSELNES